MTLDSAFLDALTEQIRKLRRNERVSPVTLLGRRFRLGSHVLDLMPLVPELLTSLLAESIEPRSVFAMSYTPSHGSLRDREGVLLCHALSPYMESVGLLGDIGRGFRLALGLGRPLHVMLAASGWTEFNWVVVDLNLKENLPPNQRWRQNLYRQLNIEAQLCTIENAPDLDDPDRVRTMASDYMRLARAVWGHDATNRRLDDAEADAYLKSVAIFSTKDPAANLLAIESVKHRLLPQITALTSVLQNLQRLDLGTFTYFFLQYFHQKRYKGFVKVAVARERDFDEPFRLIDTISESEEPEGRDPRDLMALYYSDYHYGTIEHAGRAEILTAHPYYFPSGSVYRLFRADTHRALESCIMLTDGVDKITRRLESTDAFARARLMADLLSFAHLFSLTNYDVRKMVAKWFRRIDPSNRMVGSWDEYAGENSPKTFGGRCREWGLQVFSSFASELPLPYHFLPFAWDVSPGEQAMFVWQLLESVRDTFGMPDILVEPHLSEAK